MMADQTTRFDFPEVAISLVQLEVAILVGPASRKAVSLKARDLKGMVQQGMIWGLLADIEGRIIRSS